MNNSHSRRSAAQGMLFVLAALGGQTVIAGTIYVGTCGTPNQPTIQKAVNASASGGTVKVCPGTYPEQVTITRNVNLSGVTNGTADAVVITSPAGGVLVNTADLYQPPTQPVAAQVLVQNAKDVDISNITVDGGGNLISGCAPDIRGIYYQNASGTLNGVVTRNQVLSAGLTGCQAGQGIFVQSSYSGPGYSSAAAYVTIQNSSVHTFQKNGITIDGPKAAGNITNNQIAGQGPTTGAAENGVQISDGAAASVTNNVVVDSIWAPDTFSDPGDAASGILIYASQNVLIQNNTVGTTQFGIVTVTDGTYGSTPNNPHGLADHTTIAFNQVLNTQIFDAIDVCSNNNTVIGNAVFNSAESGIHVDGTCGSTGLNNVVLNNTVNESCVGILQGPGGSSGLAAHNSLFNVVNTTLPGDTCTPAGNAALVAAAPLFNAASAGGGHPTPVQ